MSPEVIIDELRDILRRDYPEHEASLFIHVCSSFNDRYGWTFWGSIRSTNGAVQVNVFNEHETKDSFIAAMRKQLKMSALAGDKVRAPRERKKVHV